MKRTTRWISAVMVLMIAASLFPFGNGKAFASDEYDTLREKWKEMVTGGDSLNTADPDIAARIDEIGTTAQTNWTAMDTSPTRTRLWSNLGSSSNDVKLTYRKLKEMALGYAVHGSSLENDTQLRDDIISALDWMYAHNYNESTSASGNWWDWEVGTPLELNDIVVMMYGDLTSAQRTNYMNAIDHFSPVVELTGANRVWKVKVIAVRGIIVKDGAKLAAARDGLGDVFEYAASGDGFYRDGSFIQHSWFSYAGGYGKDLIADIADVMYVLNGSTWTVTDTRQNFVTRWVYDSFEPFIYKGAMMDMTRGREISRYTSEDHAIGHTVMQALIRISQFAPFADKLAIQSMIKSWIAGDTYRSYYEDASLNMIELAKQIMSDSTVTARAELLLHRQFPQMDRAVHLRPGFGFGISMQSTRRSNYESINAENKKAWHTADGMTYLYNGDLSQFSDDFWPTVNAYRLPGTTVVQNTTLGSALGGSNEVGGAALGEYGVVGMRLMPNGQTLDARKSWFMFDNEIVALGAGISSQEGAPVETIVENRKLNASGSNAFTVNGSAKSTTLGWSESLSGVNWAHLAGSATGADIGYYFPGGASLKAVREARTGKWSDLNTYSTFGKTTSITRDYLTLWFDHGTDPAAAEYAYVLLPNMTSSQLSGYAGNPDIAILENSDEAQGVEESALGIKAVQFWQNQSKTVDGITSDAIASVLVKETAGEITVSVADPTQANTGTIQIGLNSAASCVVESDDAIAAQQLGPGILLSVDVNGAKGQSRVITLKKSGACGSVSQTTAFEVENLPFASSGDTDAVYSTDTQASGGKWRKYNADAAGDYLEHAVNVPAAGTYNVSVRGKLAADRGIAQLTVQGAAVGSPIDFYKPGTAAFQTIPVGTISFAAGGPKTFRFTVTGKNGASSDYLLPLDSIVLERIGPAPSGAKLETELLAMTASAGDTAAVLSDSGSSGGKATKLTANAVNDFVSYTVNVAEPGTYRIVARTKNYTDRGRFQLYINGSPQGAAHDQYAASQSYKTYDLGKVNFSLYGNQTFKFVVTGTSGTGHTLVFDYLELVAE